MSLFIKYWPWFSSNIWFNGTIMKATDESEKMTTPCPVVSVTENEKCMLKVSIEPERQNENVSLSIFILTSHFMVLSQKSMNVAFFQRFVEYNRPTWNKILRHIVPRNLWAPGFLSPKSRLLGNSAVLTAMLEMSIVANKCGKFPTFRKPNNWTFIHLSLLKQTSTGHVLQDDCR